MALLDGGKSVTTLCIRVDTIPQQKVKGQGHQAV